MGSEGHNADGTVNCKLFNSTNETTWHINRLQSFFQCMEAKIVVFADKI